MSSSHQEGSAKDRPDCIKVHPAELEELLGPEGSYFIRQAVRAGYRVEGTQQRSRPVVRWLRQAEDDLAYAELGLRAGFCPRVCFQCQQICEKAIIALRYGRDERPVFGHAPVELAGWGAALLIGLLIALPVGIYSAVRQDTLGDYAGRSVAIFGLATPNFWLALMVLIFPGIWWGWTPPLRLFDFSEDPLAHIGMFLIPGLILGTGLSAATMRMTRASGWSSSATR